MSNTDELKKQIVVSEDHHERIKKLADRNKMNMQRYTHLLMDCILPHAESGDAQINEPSMQLKTK